MTINKTILLIFFTSVITVLSSCNANKSTVKTATESNSQVIDFRELNTGTNSGFSEKTNEAIYNQIEYNNAWERAFSKYFQKPKPQKIDFENKQLILVAMGERNSGGYKIRVKSVEESETNIIVIIEETKPGNSCLTTSVMTYPYQIIEIKKIPKKLIFQTEEKIIDCKVQE